MVQFRRNRSGDTFIKIESNQILITKVIVREYGNFKQFVIDTNEIKPEQLSQIKIHYPFITRESLYNNHLKKLSDKISIEINCSIENIQS